MQVYDTSNTLETILQFMITLLLRNCSHGGVMNAFPGRRSVIVLDNASIHHGEHDLLTRLCASKGVRVEYLPRYSPDLNPIEEYFSACKHLIRRDYQQLAHSATPVADLKAIFARQGTVENCTKWIEHAGYDDM